MRDDQHRFLMLLGQVPARLTTEQTAWVLNCQPHDVPILVMARLLKPLGNPGANSVKYFSALEVVELAKDRAWLAKVTNALSQHWQKRNAAKKNRVADDSLDETEPNCWAGGAGNSVMKGEGSGDALAGSEDRSHSLPQEPARVRRE